MSAFLGQVKLGGWRPAGAARLGQVDWTPAEAKAWVDQVEPGLRVYPECSNRFFDRAKQIVSALNSGAIQYDDLITIGASELAQKEAIDKCLSENQAAAKTKDQRIEMVAMIGGVAVALGIAYWALT